MTKNAEIDTKTGKRGISKMLIICVNKNANTQDAVFFILS